MSEESDADDGEEADDYTAARMNKRESRPPQPEPEITALTEARCPECGGEDDIERVKHPQLPPEKRGHCTGCDHRANPLAFHHSWEWERMSENEREQAREAHERFEMLC